MGDPDVDIFCCDRNSDAPVNQIHKAPTECYVITHYNMNHGKRGLAIIFNHEFFTDKYLTPRSGTNVDCQNLTNTLKDLGFEVNDVHNSTQKDIAKYLEKVAEMDHSQHDCLVVIVLSHGKCGMVNAFDTPYKVETIWEHFTADKCVSLSGKPKLFFIQACRGDRVDDGVTLKECIETDGEPTDTFDIPTYPDFLIAYSTVPGFYSWRNETHGSWFIEALCMELKDHGTQYDLLTLLTFVCQHVLIDCESKTPYNIAMHQKKQIPCITSMLTRLVKFPPVQNGTL